MRRSFFILFFLFIFLSFANPVGAETSSPQPYTIFLPALSNTNNNAPQFLSLENFTSQVINGDAETIRGVYAEGVMAFRVLQQPENNSNDVTMEPDAVTQFSLAARLGVTGLLAHNTLAGDAFDQLQIGQQVTIIYGDGRLKSYLITSIIGYEVLDPRDPYTNYRNIETNEVIGLAPLFSLYYMGEHHLTLQTCIEKNGDPGWGRLFIKASPLD